MSCFNNTEQYGVYTYFLVCGCLTVCLNAIVLVIALMYIDLHKKPNQILVVCMTGADLCFGLCFTVTRPFIACAPTWFCGPYYIVLWACQLGSTAFLLLLNVDKLIRIVWPLRYRSIATFHRVTMGSLLVWGVILLFAMGSFYEPFMNYSQFEDCVHIARFIPATYYAFMTLFGYATPTLLSMSISAAIYVFAYRASHSYIRRSSMHSSMAHTRRSSSVRRHRKIMMKRILFVFSSTLWTTVTFLPYRVAFMVYTFCATSSSSSDTSDGEVAFKSQLSEHNNQSITSSSINITTFVPVSTHVGYGADAEDSCAGAFVFTLINYLLYLLILGSLGNPIITIFTQNTYKNRMLNFWAMFAGNCRCPICFVGGRRPFSEADDDHEGITMTTNNRTETMTLSTLASHKSSGVSNRVVGFFRKKSQQDKQRRAKSLNNPLPPAFDPEMFLEEKDTDNMMEMTQTPPVSSHMNYQNRRYRLQRHARSMADPQVPRK